ncbi:MAG: cytochrome c [Proteobacteria bacterium]|nr:cytochrome c [Pseudomonadota bacterium]
MKKTLVTLLLATATASACGKTDAGGQGATAAPAANTAATAPAAAPAVANADTSLPGDPVKGEDVYKRVCLACHGADGKGNGGMTGANFIGDKTRLAKDNAILIKSVTEGVMNVPPGKPVMPPQGAALSAEEIKDAIAYVRKTFGG